MHTIFAIPLIIHICDPQNHEVSFSANGRGRSNDAAINLYEDNICRHGIGDKSSLYDIDKNYILKNENEQVACSFTYKYDVKTIPTFKFMK